MARLAEPSEALVRQVEMESGSAGNFIREPVERGAKRKQRDTKKALEEQRKGRELFKEAEGPGVEAAERERAQYQETICT